MRFRRALCRRPGPDFAAGLTTAGLAALGVDEMRAQHGAYVAALAAAGLAVEVLPELPGCPDAYFVEDAAVVVAELAIVTRPGAPQRRGEVATIAAALAPQRPLVTIAPPGRLDGGDVLQIGREVYVGLSARTDREGAGQLAAALAPHGYRVTPVAVGSGLHLKSGINALDEETVLTTAAFAGREEFGPYRRVVVPAGEEYAANCLAVNDTLLLPRGYPGTRRLLERLGRPIVELELSGARAMDGGLTCMSLRF